MTTAVLSQPKSDSDLLLGVEKTSGSNLEKLELTLETSSGSKKVNYFKCTSLTSEQISKLPVCKEGSRICKKTLLIKNGHFTKSRIRDKKKIKVGRLSQDIQICVSIFFASKKIFIRQQWEVSEKVIDVRETKDGEIIVETISSFHHIWLQKN